MGVLSCTAHPLQPAGAHGTMVGARNKDGLTKAPKFPPAQVLSWFMSHDGVAGTSPTCMGSKPGPLGGAQPAQPQHWHCEHRLLENCTVSPREAGSPGFPRATTACPRAQKKAGIKLWGRTTFTAAVSVVFLLGTAVPPQEPAARLA